MKYKNLTIIGTSHISAESLKEVKAAVEREDPVMIAVELDRRRLHSLFEDQKGLPSLRMIMKVGVKGYLFSVVGALAQKKLGKVVGVSPGSEMKAAVLLAKKLKKKVALIDQDIEITLRRFSAAISWREKGRFIVDIIRAAIFREREMKKMGISTIDLSKVPSNTLVKKLIHHLEVRYPNVHRVLVAERNVVMAKNICALLTMIEKDASEKSKVPGNLVAVIGAGHQEEVMRLVKKDYFHRPPSKPI